MGVALLSISPNNSLPVHFCLSLSSAGLEVLVPKEDIFPPGKTTTVLLSWKVRLPSGLFGLLMPLNQQADKS